MTGGRCSEVDIVIKLLGQDLGWSLLTGGCYSEVVVSTSLTVLGRYCLLGLAALVIYGLLKFSFTYSISYFFEEPIFKFWLCVRIFIRVFVIRGSG